MATLKPPDQLKPESKLMLCFLYAYAVFCPLVAIIISGCLIANARGSSISDESAGRVIKVALFFFFLQLSVGAIYWFVRSLTAK